MARNIYIESKIVIKPNALIYSRIYLKKGSTIKSNTIVKKPLKNN